MSGCNHDCGSCNKSCADRSPESLIAKPHEKSNIKKVIGIVSGKGGVGKSLVTTLMAVNAMRSGKRVGVLDADITGPSIPKAFGLKDRVTGDATGFYPVATSKGIKVISMNLLTDDESAPAVWRGPVIAGAVKQFWAEAIWGDVDYMFIDMPPGTGDVPLTVFQSIPVDGIIIVTTPQELVSMIVEKAVKMAALMNIPVIGLVENMSYVLCPDCGKEIKIFGESHLEEIASKYGITNLARIPMDPKVASLVDAGRIEDYEGDWLDKFYNFC